jgi:hypothetical protein
MLAVPACTDRPVLEGSAIEPDLTEIANGKGGKVVNRSISPLTDGKYKGLRLDERNGEGLVWIDGVDFANGAIEFDARGKNVELKSFVGVAFHGQDDRTYDAIYFRPFTFKHFDRERRNHSVQYICQPEHTWRKLRQEHPGVYENPVSPVPEPDAWFHALVVVASPKVSVFVNDAKRSCLVVEKLSKFKSGRIALWVGDTSGGDFANLKVTPANAP